MSHTSTLKAQQEPCEEDTVALPHLMRRFRRGVFGWFSGETQFGGGLPAAVRAVLRRGATRAGLTSPEGKQDRRWQEAAGCAFLLLVLRTAPRKAAVPPVNSLSLGAGLLAHCSGNSLNCLPSKAKSSTEPPSGRVEVGHLV